VVATNFIDVTPSFSPDGKWLAYANNETGRYEVYIQPFPSGAGRWQVSPPEERHQIGGRMARNSSFFRLTGRSWLWMLARTEPACNWARPTPCSKPHRERSPGTLHVSADGKKFVMNTVLPQSITEPLTLITNWPADLKKVDGGKSRGFVDWRLLRP